MDQKETAIPITTTKNPPAQLWVGNHYELEKKVILHLQTHFCSTQTACRLCSSCRLIKNKTHHAVEWIKPDKRYTLEQVSIIRNRIAFQLGTNEHYFFILQQADFLTTSCANSLLKSLEEPPRGYHFILLAERKDAVLPTIQSRCIISTINPGNAQQFEIPLFAFFSTHVWSNPVTFLKELEAAQLHEKQSLELLNQLIAHWRKLLNKAIAANNHIEVEQNSRILEAFTKALETPPMPGSSKIFWKDLFLTINFLSQHSKNKSTL